MAVKTDQPPQSLPSTSPPPTTYQLKPSTTEKFRPDIIKNLLNEILNDTLQGQTYMSLLNTMDEQGNGFCDSLAEKIKEHVVGLGHFADRYKYVCHVELVQNSGARCQILAKCVWDDDNDGMACVTYKNEDFYVAASVFAIYLY